MHNYLYQGGDCLRLCFGEGGSMLCYDAINSNRKGMLLLHHKLFRMILMLLVFFSASSDRNHSTGWWVVERPFAIWSGTSIPYGEGVWLRNLGSGEYLAVKKSPGKRPVVYCTLEYTSPDCLFAFHSLSDVCVLFGA